jgi:hypothetical protein
MNYKAYNELRLMGHDPETAMELAKTYQLQGIYEQKKAVDHTRRGSFARVIGLKDEWKPLTSNKEVKDA